MRRWRLFDSAGESFNRKTENITSLHGGYPAILHRDNLESRRLNMQHEIFIASLGYLLHSTVKERRDIKVADVATGTGIWLTDLAKELNGNNEFVGFDVTDAYFPYPSSLPKGVRFLKHNMFEPFDTRFHDYFDVVNIRMVFSALRKEQWLGVLHNLITIVKPGGFLQWSEYDPTSRSIHALKEGASIDNLKLVDDMLSRYMAHTGRDRDCGPIRQLQRLFDKAGLVDCVEDTLPIDRNRSVRSKVNEHSLTIRKAVLMQCVSLADFRVPGLQNPEQVKELIARCEEEVEDEKAIMRYRIHLVVGQKPEATEGN